MINYEGLTKNEIGQSLLEVTVLVGLALLTVSGLVIVTVNSLKNSQYSQNQAQATKLAQEGIDQVKSIADRNCPVSSGGSYLWFNSANSTGSDLIWSQTWAAERQFRIQNFTTCTESIPGLVQGSPDINPTAAGGIFTRNISIRDSTSCSPTESCKIIKVTVSWTDTSGSHQSHLATMIIEH